MEHKTQIPIWFFIGLILTVNGLLIVGSGIYGAINPPPPETRVKLWNLHADIWWGALLVILGTIYIAKFKPKKG